ncbi:MAG: ABC transporter substrate-binding protein [SAR202 cluster bacterium]|nr:ABC transporter substrate-binding protein [SAR202 cluster bacterium]
MATATATTAPTATATATATAAPTATPTPQPSPFAGVPGIVNPNNRGWPRQVEVLNGIFEIRAKPARIVTVSIGHDEITYALVPATRVVGVGGVSKDTTYSNVAEIAKAAPSISTEPETILSVKPDIMVTSAFFNKEKVAALERAGLQVLVTDLSGDPAGRRNTILLMGYIYGEEERAIAFAKEIDDRHKALQSVVGNKPSKPKVLAVASYGDQIYTAGLKSTEGGIIEAAGGINAAAEAKLEFNPVISAESIISMSPEVIIITQPNDSGDPFKDQLMKNAALAQVPAIKNNKIYVVDPKLYTTLSHWNLRGAEDLAKILWPQDFANKQFGGFSSP